MMEPADWCDKCSTTYERALAFLSAIQICAGIGCWYYLLLLCSSLLKDVPVLDSFKLLFSVSVH